MKVSGIGSAPRRRVLVCAGLIVALFAAPSSGWAQDPAPAAADQFKFTSQAGLMTWQVKADKTADFESVWVALKTKLMASDKPEHKALAESFRMYKLDVPPQAVPGAGSIAIYYFIADPPSTTNSYDPSKLLYESGDLFPRAEADALFNKLVETLAGAGGQPLKKVQ